MRINSILKFIYKLIVIVFITVSCNNISRNHHLNHCIIKNKNTNQTHNNYFDSFNNRMSTYVRKAKKVGLGLFSLYALSLPQTTSAEFYAKKVSTSLFNIYGRALSLGSNDQILGAGHTNIHGMISKFDTDGSVTSSEVFPGLYKMSDVEQTSNLGVVFTGDSDIGNTTFSSIFVGQVSSSDLISQACYEFGGSLDDNSAFITETSNNNLFVGGSTKSFGPDRSNIISFSFNQTGVFWANAYGTSSTEVIMSGTKTRTGKVVLAGYTGDLMEYVLFAQINPLNGSLENSIMLNGSRNARALGITNSGNSGTAFTGIIRGTTGLNNIIVGKLDSTNTPVWITEVYSTLNVNLEGWSITEKTGDGGFIVVGKYTNPLDNEDPLGNAFIGTFSSSGTFLGAESLGGDSMDEAFAVLEKNDDIYVFGSTKSYNNMFGFLLSKLNESGTSGCTDTLTLSSTDLTSSWLSIPLSLSTTDIIGSLSANSGTCGSSNITTSVNSISCSGSSSDDDEWYETWWGITLIVIGGLIALFLIGLALYCIIKACINRKRNSSNNDRSKNKDGSLQDREADDTDNQSQESTTDEDNEEGDSNITTKENESRGYRERVPSYESDDSLINDGHRIQLQQITSYENK